MAATKVLAQPDSKKPKEIAEIAAGIVVLGLDTRMDRRGRSFIYHRAAGAPGWSPTHSDDNMPVLVPVRSPRAAKIEAKQPPRSGSAAESAPASAERAKVEVGSGKPPPALAQPEPQTQAPAGRVRPQRSQSQTELGPPPGVRPERSKSTDLGPLDEAGPAKYVPRGRTGSMSGRLSGRQQQTPAPQAGSTQPWQRVRSSIQEGRLASADGRTKVRLLYVSAEHGFGMEYGLDDQTPIVANYLGVSAQRAGVVLGSTIAAVDGLPVTSIQHLAQVLQQKEHIARQFADTAVEFELVPPAVAKQNDLLSLIGGATPSLSGLGNIVENEQAAEASDPHASELKQLEAQIAAVGKVAEQHLRAIPNLRASLAAATTEEAKADLREEMSDNESALKQQQVTQSQLFKKQLRLIAVTCEELTKQRDFQVEEAKKFVTFQIQHMLEKESAIKGKQGEIHQAFAKAEEQTKAQDQKQGALLAEHSETTAPIKAQMELHLKEVAALDKEIAALLAKLKAKQNLRDETMDKADELKGSITAQLKLFAAPALEQIEQERQDVAQRKALLQKQQDCVKAEIHSAQEGRAAAAKTRTQREAKIDAVTEELRRLQHLGGQSAMALERLRTDGEARARLVSTTSSAAKAALADADRAVEALENSEAAKAARSLQSLHDNIPRLEAEIAAQKTRLDRLGADKLAFAKAKQFKEAGQAKKDIDATDEQLVQLEAQLVKERATASSSTAQEAAKAYATELLTAQQAAITGASLIAASLLPAQAPVVPQICPGSVSRVAVLFC